MFACLFLFEVTSITMRGVLMHIVSILIDSPFAFVRLVHLFVVSPSPILNIHLPIPLTLDELVNRSLSSERTELDEIEIGVQFTCGEVPGVSRQWCLPWLAELQAQTPSQNL